MFGDSPLVRIEQGAPPEKKDKPPKSKRADKKKAAHRRDNRRAAAPAKPDPSRVESSPSLAKETRREKGHRTSSAADDAWLEGWIERVSEADGIQSWPVLQPNGVRANLTSAWGEFAGADFEQAEHGMQERINGEDFHDPQPAQLMAAFFRECIDRKTRSCGEAPHHSGDEECRGAAAAAASNPRGAKKRRPRADQMVAEASKQKAARIESDGEQNEDEGEDCGEGGDGLTDAELAEQAAMEEAMAASLEASKTRLGVRHRPNNSGSLGGNFSPPIDLELSILPVSGDAG